jgi:hypothetical protein
VRALLTTRKLLQGSAMRVEMSIRGMLCGFGLKVGPTTPKTFEHRIRELVENQEPCSLIADALFKAGAALGLEFRAIEKRFADHCPCRQTRPAPDDDARCRRSSDIMPTIGLMRRSFVMASTPVAGKRSLSWGAIAMARKSL